MVPRNHMVIRVAEDGTEWSAELRKYFHGVTSQCSVSVPVLFRPVFRGFTRTRRTTDIKSKFKIMKLYCLDLGKKLLFACMGA